VKDTDVNIVPELYDWWRWCRLCGMCAQFLKVVCLIQQPVAAIFFSKKVSVILLYFSEFR